MQRGLFSSYYLAPIEFYYYCSLLDDVTIDTNEHFIKQTYRSRCYITGPNGVKSLSIPLQSVQKKRTTKDTRICYKENWQKIHWKSLEAGYRRSPYFEYYEHLFEPFYTNRFDFLVDFNMQLHQAIISALGTDVTFKQSDKYIEQTEDFVDFRNSFSPKNNNQSLHFPKYVQVFEDRNPFAPNLSIVDLLFNEGPNALSYINTIKNNKQ